MSDCATKSFCGPEYAGLIFKHRKLLVLNFVLSLCISVLTAFCFVKPQHSSSITFLPPTSPAQNLSAIFSGVSLTDLTETSITPPGIITVFNSQNLHRKVIERFDLYRKYKIKDRPGKFLLARKRLLKDLEIEAVDAGTMGVLRYVSYTIKTFNTSADTSRLMAEYVFSLIDSTVINLNSSAGRCDREFFETRLYESRIKLDSLQACYKKFQMQNRIYSFSEQPRLAMENYAAIKAVIIANQIIAGQMGHDFKPNFGEIQAIAKTNAILENRLDSLEKTERPEIIPGLENSVELAHEISHFFREMEIQKQVCRILATELNHAVLKEKSGVSRLSVIDPPFPRQYKTRPNRLAVILMITAAHMLFFLAAMALIPSYAVFYKNRFSGSAAANVLFKRTILFTRTSSLISLCIFAASHFAAPLYLYALPFLALFLPLFITWPAIAVFGFLTSFFAGFFFVNTPAIGITLADIWTTLLFVVFAGPFLIGTRKKLLFQQTEMAILLPLIILFIWSGISILFNMQQYDAKQFAASFWFMIRFCQMIILFAIAPDIISAVGRKRITHILLVLFAIQIPVSYAQYILTSHLGFLEGRIAVTGTFTSHHSVLGSMMLIGAAICISLFITTKTLMQKMFFGLLTTAMIYVIYISGVRAALLGIIAALSAILIIKFRKRPFTLLLATAIAAYATIAFFRSPIGSGIIRKLFFMEDGTPDLSSISRLFIWEGAWEYFTKMTLWEKFFGVGIGAFQTVRYSFVLWDDKFISGAHCNFLHVLLETGIVGLAIFLWINIQTLCCLYRKSGSSPLAKTCFYTGVALLASGLVQETFWFQKSMGIIWPFFLFITVLAVYEEKPPEENMKNKL
jgi:O-antigen ligase